MSSLAERSITSTISCNEASSSLERGKVQRYVIEYLDEHGNPHAAYYKTKHAAELFFGTLHGRGLQFYSEEVVHSAEEFEVFRRVKQFHPPEKSNAIKPS